MALLFIIGTLFSLQLAYYVLYTPHPSLQPRQVNNTDKLFAQAAYGLAYILALLRLPFAVLPYGFKLLNFFVFKQHYSVSRNQYFIEAVRIVGDFSNLALGIVFIQSIEFLSRPAYVLLMSCAAAEAIRLFAEKGQMVFSALWQSLPHRAVAHFLALRLNSLPNFLRTRIGWYCQYYMLNDEERAAYVLDILRSTITSESETSQKLSYITKLKIIATTTGLRGGHVRDVARGEIFIHRRWTGDPWLLIGQALRRSPWIFDPRYLPRPFYYRSQSNRLATLFVFQHAKLCPSYTLYQFGHEIKAARYDLFYRLCRWVGHDIEPKVQSDGTFPFDRLINWLQCRRNGKKPSVYPLLSDEQVISDLQNHRTKGDNLSALDIAVRYTYPVKYVQEVLMAKLS